MFITKFNETSSIIELKKPLPIIQPQTYLSENFSVSTNYMFWTYKYISKKYPDFDWYLKTDDKTFFFMQNLRKYLHKQNSSSSNGLNCARDWSSLVRKNLSLGLTSFLLSKEAMINLGNTLIKNPTYCPNMSHEYIDTNECLKRLNIKSCNHKLLFYEKHFMQDYKKKVIIVKRV